MKFTKGAFKKVVINDRIANAMFQQVLRGNEMIATTNPPQLIASMRPEIS